MLLDAAKLKERARILRMIAQNAAGRARAA
jgi:hypothetical protein